MILPPEIYAHEIDVREGRPVDLTKLTHHGELRFRWSLHVNEQDAAACVHVWSPSLWQWSEVWSLNNTQPILALADPMFSAADKAADWGLLFAELAKYATELFEGG